MMFFFNIDNIVKEVLVLKSTEYFHQFKEKTMSEHKQMFKINGESTFLNTVMVGLKLNDTPSQNATALSSYNNL